MALYSQGAPNSPWINQEFKTLNIFQVSSMKEDDPSLHSKWQGIIMKQKSCIFFSLKEAKEK